MTAQVIERDKLGVLTKVGQGGQGVVYRAPNVKTKFAASMVYKEYKAQIRADIDFTALAAMPALVEDSLSYAQGERLISIAAWPCALVENGGTPAGFVMPAIPDEFFIPLTTVKGVSMSTAEFQHLLNHASVLAARDITIDDAQRYSLLLAAASALAFLHKHGVCVGDISPKNLLFTLKPHEAIYFIDCDAMRINAVSALPQVETPGWDTPPGEERATIYSDTYKLGLLALRLLAGDHDTKDPQHLPSTTPGVLRQIITDTLTNQPHQRPLPEAWTYVLGHAIEEAQHHQKTAAAAESPVAAALAPPAVPEVRSRPKAPTAQPKPAVPRPASPAPPMPLDPNRLIPSRTKLWPVAAGVAIVVAALVAVVVVVALKGGNNSPSSSGAVSTAPPGCGDPGSLLASMSSRDKLAQLLVVGVTGTADARAVVSSQHVGGISIGNGTDLSMLTDGSLADIAGSAGPLHLAVSVDEEGGRVQRVSSLIGRLPSARVLAQTRTPDRVYQLALDHGRKLRNLGITIDFAPVVDVTDAPDDTVIGDRSFSADPAVVTQYAGRFAGGLRDAGVLPVLKYFPGHGRASGDASGLVTPPLVELQDFDLVPYRTLVTQLPVGVMVGHMQVPGLTGDDPAGLSAAAVALLRNGSGYGGPPFNGLVFTDDLSSNAIADRYGLAEAALKALQAGADTALVMTSGAVPAVLDRLQTAVAGGELSMPNIEASVRRIAAAKGSGCHY